MKKYIYIFLAVVLTACGSKQENQQEVTVKTEIPSNWIKNATIYEVNVRQYTEEGTLAAFEQRLPKLKELGVDVLWFMPIQPIGKLNRKAVGDTFVQDLPNPDYVKYWGSPYSISDYTTVNPRYGTVEDFKRIIQKCHEMDMYVVLDWVGNHTAWDNPWVSEHPDWYTHDSTGKITDPIGADGKSWGWTDVADLNYDNKDMRAAMIESMKFWVDECNLDGFRCDVAMEVPTDFWEEARAGIEEIKSVFMLAESEAHKPDQFNSAFDAYYGWEMHHVFNKLYNGEVNAHEVIRVMNDKDSLNGTKAFPMNMITNHDENSWNGTIEERLGESWKSMAVLSYALRGIPLIYSGQEAGLKHRLSFFAKDEINWDAPQAEEHFDFYKVLNEIKANPVLAVDSKIAFNVEYMTDNLITIDRGDNAEYRFIITLKDAYPTMKVADQDPKTGYNIIFTDGYSDETGELSPWGFIVLKKKQ
jgi:glycosidase